MQLVVRSKDGTCCLCTVLEMVFEHLGYIYIMMTGTHIQGNREVKASDIDCGGVNRSFFFIIFIS